ncbi:hypothetical protein WJX82_011017 [Trebouxia sp. C0006]
MSRSLVRHTPAALCVFVISLCLQVSYVVSESSTQAVLSRKAVSAGFTARRLLQDAEMDVESSDPDLWEQPEGLTEVSSQSDKTALLSEDVSEATTSADQFDMDPSGESEGQIAELEMGLSKDDDIPEAESDNDDLTRVSLAEVGNENPFLIQSIEHGQDEETPSSAQQSTDQETFSSQHTSSGSDSQHDSQHDRSQDDDLTFDEALAQAASGKDLSDESGNTDSSDSTADLTFAEAVAATKGTQSVSDVIANKTRASSSHSDDPTAETPVLESLLPSVESMNGSLSAAISEPDTASSVNASSSSTSSSADLSSLVGTAAGAAGQKLSEAADASASLLDEDTSSIQADSSAVNTTRDFLSGAASSAAGTAAGGAETDSLLPADMLNSTVLNSSAADGVIHSSLQKVGGVLSGVRSWLNSSSAEEDADDEYTTTTAASSTNQTARSGAKAGQIQEPLTDLEQLKPEEEEELDFGNAGLIDAASTTGALGQQSSSSSSSSSKTAAGSRPAHSSGQSRPAAQRSARPSAQGTAATALANATDAATFHHEDDDQLETVSQTRPNAAGAQSKSGATSSAQAALRLRQQQEEAQEEEYLERQANPVSASKAVKPANVSQQARPVSGTNAGQSASSGRLGAVDKDEYLDASERASQGSTSSRPGLQGTASSQAGSDFDEDYADEIAAGQAGKGSSAAAQLANSKAQQSLATSGFDDDPLVEDDSLGGLQGSATTTGTMHALSSGVAAASSPIPGVVYFAEDDLIRTQSVPIRQSGTSAKTGSQQSRLPSGRQGAVVEDEFDLGSDWPRTGASGTTPAGKSASSSSGRAGTGGSSKQASSSHQPGQTRDAQTNAFRTAGNAAATGFGSQYAGAASAEDEESLMQPLGQTAATHSGQANSARAGSRDQPSALPSSRSASAGSDPLGKTTSGSGSAASSGTRTPAQQRELEREMAFKASTGSGANDLMDSKSVDNSLGSLNDRGAASGQSWSALANQNRGTTAGGASSNSQTGAAGSSQSVNTRQQPLGDGESEADIGDYDSRAFGSDSSSSSTSGFGQSEYPRLVASDTTGTDSRSFAAGSKGGAGAGSRSGTALGDDFADSSSFGLGTGSTTKTTSGFGDGVADSRNFGVDSDSGSKSTSGFGGNMADGSNSRVRSGFGDEDEGDSSSFLVGRDPTNPSSVVGAQQGFNGQAHAVQQRTSAANAGSNAMGGLPAGKTKMSLDADEDEEVPLLAGSQSASQALSKMNGADVDKSGGGLAGPIVTGSSDDEYVTRPQAGGRQSSDASSTLHSLLDSVINNWVVITALSVFACTGAVLAFVFLRGFVPSPYDVITFSNVGTAGYAGNNGGYTGVSREDEENGWENGWGDDDAQVVSPQQKRSSSNSPPRGTGVGKLKKGTFAKKKPANWSNDF